MQQNARSKSLAENVIMGQTKALHRGKNYLQALSASPVWGHSWGQGLTVQRRAAYRLKGYVNYQGTKPVPLSLQTQSKAEMCVVTQSSNTTLPNCSCPVQ